MRKCGAKTSSGGKCQYGAGHGTDHPGTGKCRLHGGASKGAPKGNKNALKHGIYSKIFSDQELTEAKAMQGTVETELAIARLQLANLLRRQQQFEDRLHIDKIEERTIVTDEADKDKEKKKKKDKFLKHLLQSAKQAGEEYDPDGDEYDMVFNGEDYHFKSSEDEEDEDIQESDVFERKRTYLRRDFQNEFVRLVSLIARLEQQLVSTRKAQAEIKVIEATGDKADNADDKLTDTELDREIQGFVERCPL